MLEFLKKLFEKKEEILEIEFLELARFIETRLDIGLNHDFGEINAVAGKLSASLEALQSFDIESVKVEEKLKDYVKGNRRAYEISLKAFLSEINSPKSFDSASVEKFCNEIDEGLASLTEKTARNYYIMKSLIGKELEEIRQGLSQLDSIVKRIRGKLKNGNVKAMEIILEKLREIYAYLENKETRSKKMAELEARQKELMDKESRLKGEIENFRQSDAFYELETLKSMKTEAGCKLFDLKDKLAMDIAEISRPLRKLLKLTNDGLIMQYLDNSYSALVADESLEIVNVLGSLKSKMQARVIEEKNNEKLIKLIGRMNAEYFSEIRKKCKSLEIELAELNEKISVNPFDSELNALLMGLKTIEPELASVSSDIDSIKSRAIADDIMKIVDEIKQLGIRAVIKNAPYDKEA